MSDEAAAVSIEPSIEPSTEPSDELPADLRAALLCAGDVGTHLLRVDWAATPLGPAAGWPQSLRTALSTLLSSRFPMWMAWGPDLTFFCNEAYRRDTLRTKFPWALGRPASEVWSEIWSDIGPRIESVLTSGEATWDEALLLFLERSGYPEETYHTFSYSPLRAENGGVGGMLCVVSEDTDRVISDRRMRTLRDLGSEPTALRTEADVLASACRHLATASRSLPFTLVYLFEEGGDALRARLACSTGFEKPSAAAPAVIEAADPHPLWPVAALSRSETVTVPLSELAAELPSGEWGTPAERAFVVPLSQPGGPRPYGFFVAGVSPYRPLDDGYRDFVELVATQIAAGIAVARSYENERTRAEKLAELDTAKTAFFTNISHEFRTPLTLLLAPAEDALADELEPLGPAQRERLTVVHRNAQRLLALVNALLDFSRLQAGKATPVFEPVDLAAYTSELASMFASAADRAELAFHVETQPLPAPVSVDREMWAKILLNLLSNALKFTFSGGITVRLAPVEAADGAADRVELTVTDTGIGIDPAEQPNLFARFHRVSGARSRTHEGSGIGLALVAELVELHGGEVSVSSTPGAGSTFTARIPFDAAVPADQLDQAASPTQQRAAAGDVRQVLTDVLRWMPTASSEQDKADSGAGGSSGQPGEPPAVAAPPDAPRVLVVDDNPDMRRYVVQLLAGEYAVAEAVDGLDGLAQSLASPPDLVITDVMMPNLDGFGLLTALRADPATVAVPVIMLSARTGEDGAVEGLEAGADDYLGKPFAARELRARVRSNLEMDRTRRVRDELQKQQKLLDQAQRLARVGSWEVDLRSGTGSGSGEFLRLLGSSAEVFRSEGLAGVMPLVHPEDIAMVTAAVDAAITGAPLDIEVRAVLDAAGMRTLRVRGELRRDAEGSPAAIGGSVQDVTEQREAELAVAAAAAEREAGRREHRIADELQRSLLPARSIESELLDVATFYRAGVEGTQVGGDWYDVIELGADRTAVVIGDVMGRGVRAAAVMGQLRSATRAYARLDLPPADVLEFLDGVVRDLGDDQIVTCTYAVYDPADGMLTLSSAGHLPALLSVPDQPLHHLHASGPPLGTGPFTLDEQRVEMPPGSTLTLYTDGLVERRDRDLDAGIEVLAERISAGANGSGPVPAELVEHLLPDGPDDDVAVLVARVPEQLPEAETVIHEFPDDHAAVGVARRVVTDALSRWGVPESTADSVSLLASELVTNAVLYARAPYWLRLRRTLGQIRLEVHDGATFLPRRQRPTPTDEHGRGLQLVALLADRWGSRPTTSGKVVWCMVAVDPTV